PTRLPITSRGCRSSPPASFSRSIRWRVMSSWALAVKASASASNSVLSALASKARILSRTPGSNTTRPDRGGRAFSFGQDEGGGVNCGSGGSIPIRARTSSAVETSSDAHPAAGSSAPRRSTWAIHSGATALPHWAYVRECATIAAAVDSAAAFPRRRLATRATSAGCQPFSHSAASALSRDSTSTARTASRASGRCRRRTMSSAAERWPRRSAWTALSTSRRIWLSSLICSLLRRLLFPMPHGYLPAPTDSFGGVEASDEGLGGDGSVGVLHDVGDHIPIHVVDVQVDADPAPGADVGRTEVGVGTGGDERLLGAFRRRAPKGNPVVVVVVGVGDEHPLSTHEPRRLPVALPFRHLRQREADAPQCFEWVVGHLPHADRHPGLVRPDDPARKNSLICQLCLRIVLRARNDCGGDMSNKVALVTGSNKGIGREIARGLGRLGMAVYASARDEERGRQTAEELRNEGIDVRFLQLDVTDEESIRRAADEIDRSFGRLDVLVHNAGITVADERPTRTRPSNTIEATSATADHLRQVFEVNTFGTVAVTRAMLPLLRRSDGARVVNMSSPLGSLTLHSDLSHPVSQVGLLAYSSSKAALNMITIMYANALRDTGIKVNAANPGRVATALNDFSGERTPEQGAAIAIRLATLGDDGPPGGSLGAAEPGPRWAPAPPGLARGGRPNARGPHARPKRPRPEAACGRDPADPEGGGRGP